MASNFFQLQDSARKHTRVLVLLFILAVLSLIALTNLFIMVFPFEWNAGAFSEGGANSNLLCLMNEQCAFWQQINWNKVLVVSLVISLVIGLASLYKWMQIRQGGRAIAQMMGGELVELNSSNLAEQRLLNVVQEMALAANMPVPEVYVLKNESGINAFAAGFSSKDAVVAVTQGALDAFNRDQLQGVIGHEFSHILNGDMRLNMKLIAILHGILFITLIGYSLLDGSRFSSRNRNAGPVILLGLGLIILGYLGTFFGSLIKAAVSRQREFLADASAVQFTRNPSGIADALKVIGGSVNGSEIGDQHGSEISHFFFGSAKSSILSLFATHPPLEQRIRQIEPTWNGQFLQAKPQPVVVEAERPSTVDYQQKAAAAMVMAGAMAAAQGQANTRDADYLDNKALVLKQLNQPLTAAAIILCLLYDKKDDAQPVQAQWPELYSELQAYLWMNWKGDAFVPIVNQAVPALRLLSAEQYQQLKALMVQAIKADKQIDLYEWALFQLVCTSLDNHYDNTGFNHYKYRKIEQIEQETQTVMAMVVQASSASDDEKISAFHQACQTAGLSQASTTILAQVTMASFDEAVKKISLAYPLLKPRIIKGLIAAAKADGKIDPIERQSIIAISASIDAPLPEALLTELEIDNNKRC